MLELLEQDALNQKKTTLNVFYEKMKKQKTEILNNIVKGFEKQNHQQI